MPGRRDVYDAAMRQGHSAAWDQQWEQAIAAYRRAAEEFPEDSDALSSLGLALLQDHQLDGALAVYERAARLNSTDPVAQEKSAEILERLGRFDDASPRYMAVAELHLSRRDVDKAIDNWARAARLNPDLLLAHQRLALAYDRTGKRGPAVTAYLNVARLLQSQGDYEKAAEAAERARALEPRNSDVLRAVDLLQRGLALPRIKRPGGVTDALRAARSALPAPDALAAGKGTGPLAAEPVAASDAGNNPAEAARQKALSALAAYLFDLAAEEGREDSGVKEGGLGQLFGRKPNRTIVVGSLAQAIDAQKRRDVAGAVAALEKALAAGLDLPAAHFSLGLLYLDSADEPDSPQRAEAVSHLQAAVADPTLKTGASYALASLALADRKNRDALRLLLEVLRDVDLQTVRSARRPELSRLYDALIEDTLGAEDEGQVASVAANLAGFLSGPGWLDRVQAARGQMDAAAAEVDGALSPLADVVAMPGSERVIEALRLIDQCVTSDYLTSAMDEAFRAVELAPAYLPLHLRIGEILVKEDRLEAAIAKYMAVAQVYEVRGDTHSAGRILERVIRLAPMDPAARDRLIRLLVEQNKIEEALGQHLDLAEAYYRQADLSGARQTFADGLQLAKRSSDEQAWSVQFLHAMGDIDMQRLDWRQALRVYQQIKTLAPADEKARNMLADLHFRLGQQVAAMSEVDDWLRFHLQQGRVDQAMSLLEELVRQRPDEPGLRTRLARFYQERGRKGDAIAQLDALGELQIRAGHTQRAAETIRAILALHPDSAENYRQLLAQLESSQG